MSVFTSLETAKRGILAQRYGMDVTSNNIANVNTPGYARRTAVMAETDPHTITQGFIGTGVVLNHIQSYRQEYFDREVRNNLSRRSAYEADDRTMKRVETSLGEPSDYGIDSSIDNFFNSFESLTLQPENITRREEVLRSAENLAETFNNVGRQFQELREQTGKGINNAIDTANALMKTIADLNGRIASTRTDAQGESATLVDQREQKLEELSKIMNLQVNFDTSNIANISVNGENVVSGTLAHTLERQDTTDPVTQEMTATIALRNTRTNTLIGSVSPSSGELSSHLRHFNVTLDDRDTSGGYSIIKSLDTLAATIVDKVNTLSRAGYGLDDATAPSPARNIFTPATPGGQVTALSISLSADVAGQPRNLPMSATPGAPGNSEIGRQIATLATSASFLSGSTPSQAYSLILSKTGSIGQEAINNLDVASAAETQLNAQREAVTGVNMDEEAMNLIRYQKAFEAAARVVNTTSELLSTVINLGR